MAQIVNLLLAVLFYTRGSFAVSTAGENLGRSDCLCHFFHPSFPANFPKRCISKTMICNGIKDCKNGTDEDEIYCESHVCELFWFKCDGICKSDVLRCNGRNDCKDGKDEKDCDSYECRDRVKCKTSPICIDRSDVCNGQHDCPDFSDEVGCYECESYASKCDNLDSKCVNSREHCDGYKDCENGSDEEACEARCVAEEEIKPSTSNEECADLAAGDAHDGLCRFGLDGDYCNETCSECRRPFCETTPHDESHYYKLFGYTEGARPCVPNDAEKLDIFNFRLNNIYSAVLSELSSKLKILRLSNVSYRCMDMNFLAKASMNLKFLYLNRMGFTDDSLPTLKNLKKLLILNLDYNSITVLSDDVFEGSNDVSKISVAHNKLRRVQAKLFFKMGDLLELHLAFNSLDRDIDLTGLAALRFIDLSHNCIGYIPESMFRDLRDLKRMNLAGNPITKLPLMRGVAIGAQLLMIITSGNLNCSSLDPHQTDEMRCNDISLSTHSKNVTFLAGMVISDSNNACRNDTCFPDKCTDLIGGMECGEENCGSDECFVRKNSQCSILQEGLLSAEGAICENPCDCQHADEPVRCSNTVMSPNLLNSLCLPRRTESIELRNITLSIQGFYELISKFYQLSVVSLGSMDVDFLWLLDNSVALNFTGLTLESVGLETVPEFLSKFAMLTELAITRNDMSIIDQYAFSAHAKLRALSLARNKITQVSDAAFSGLENLISLDLSYNNIVNFHPGVFVPVMNIEVLNVSKNLAYHYPNELLQMQSKLSTVHGDVFIICCLVEWLEGVQKTCTPEDEMSSCERLIANDALRVLIWIQALLTAVGNVTVVILRMREYREVGRSVHQKTAKINIFLIGMLALADFVMCAYLFTVAAADEIYAGEYFLHSLEWLRSPACSAAGVMAVLSSEASVLLLSLITVTRLLSVMQPLNYLTVDVRMFYFSAGVIWAVAIALALAPFMGFGMLDNYFSSSSATCLPSFYTSKVNPSWVYTFVIVLINLFCFMMMLTAYAVLIHVARKNREISKKLMMSTVANRRASARSRKLTIRVAVLVLTDMLCWLPVCVASLLSIASGGLSVGFHRIFYPVTAIVLMPVNSTFNPVIYTLLTSTSLSKKLKSAVQRLGTESDGAQSSQPKHSKTPGAATVAGKPKFRSTKNPKDNDVAAATTSGTASTMLTDE